MCKNGGEMTIANIVGLFGFMLISFIVGYKCGIDAARRANDHH